MPGTQHVYRRLDVVPHARLDGAVAVGELQLQEGRVIAGAADAERVIAKQAVMVLAVGGMSTGRPGERPVADPLARRDPDRASASRASAERRG
jgi:hypothetical protein